VEWFPSGQREQTVNLSSDDFGGSNPPLSTIDFIGSGNSSFGRAIAFQAVGGGFEPRFPLHFFLQSVKSNNKAHIAQPVEHLLGKEEVIGSSPIVSSILFIIFNA
jgi:hypothetical protein